MAPERPADLADDGGRLPRLHQPLDPAQPRPAPGRPAGRGHPGPFSARLLCLAAAEDPELGLFLRLAVVLGARRGELCALRWSEIDLDKGEVLIASAVVRVPHKALLVKQTKIHAKRCVAVGAGTVEELRARRVAQAKDALARGSTLAADAYLFSHVPDGSAPLDPDGISHRFQRLARRLGVRCRLHDLRHFMVPSWSRAG